MAEEKKRRQRRRFTEEFKAEVVKKVLSSGKTAGQVARDLDLTETAVRAWVKQAAVDKSKGGTLASAEKEELARLRKENRELKEDREILKKAAAGSTGRRNDSSEGSCWRFEGQCLSGTQQRRHSVLSYVSPAEFERAARTVKSAA